MVSALVFGRRLEFHLAAADRAALLEDYLPYAGIVAVPDQMPELPVQCRDRDDVVFLALATVTQTPLISGDADLSVLKSSAPVGVLSVAELWRLISEHDS